MQGQGVAVVGGGFNGAPNRKNTGSSRSGICLVDILYLLLPPVIGSGHCVGRCGDLTGPAYHILEDDDEQLLLSIEEGCAKPV